MNPRPSACWMLLGALLLGAPSAVRAQDDLPESPPEETTKTFTWLGQASFTWQGETDIDRGGAFQVDRFAVSAGGAVRVAKPLSLGAYAVYRRDDYDFSGSSGFGNSDPWSDINQFRIGLGARVFFTEHWSMMGGGFLDYSGETGVSFEAGRNWGGLGAVSYTRDENLSLGLGVFTMNRQQEVRIVYPLVLFNWRFAKDWVLRNGSFPLGPNGAAGVELAWDFLPGWEVSANGQYQTRLFRLDDSGPAPNGFGLEDAIPVFGTLSYRQLAWLRMDLFAGAMLAGELELEYSNGHRVARLEYNPAPFFGLRATFLF